MPDVALSGCSPEPLMNYLKALGVFRLVAEQRPEVDARLAWRGGVAHLDSQLDREALIEFFVNEYRPTPIVGPWGGRSGFYPGSSESGAREALNGIVKTANKDERLQPFATTIKSVRGILETHGFSEKVRDEDKLRLMSICRNELDDSVLAWLDCVYILTEDSRRFPPLLGTGGNEGSASYVSTFAQIVSAIFTNAPRQGDVANSIFGDFETELGAIAVGHFNPGAIGGPNSSQGFSGGGGVNTWDYLLAIEGCLIFAGAAARKYGSDTKGKASFPFCVEAVAVGYSTESDREAASTRAEMWLPLWSQPIQFSELTHLFGEGRAQIGRRQAKNAVEFALATSLLGVSRGIKSFLRYAFVMRNGLNYFAAPLGRIEVRERPAARLLEDPALLDWHSRLRNACSDKEKTPDRYQTALRQLDRAIFEFAARSEVGNDAPYLQNVLVALGKAERTLSGGPRFVDDKRIRPLQGLNADWWKIAALDSGTMSNRGIEFRLAAALAGIEAERDVVPSLRAYLEPVERDGRFFKWSPGSTSAVWSNRPLADNLAAVFMRRQLEAFRNGWSDVPLSSSIDARPADVVAFLEGDVDEDKLTALLWALIGVDCPNSEDSEPQLATSEEWRVPFEFAVPRSVVKSINVRGSGAEVHKTVPDPDVFLPLLSGRDDAVTEAVTRAARRLRSCGLTPIGYGHRAHGGSPLTVVSPIRPERLLAAMLFPLSDRDLRTIAERILPLPDTTEE